MQQQREAEHREETLGDIEYALRAQAPENAVYKVQHDLPILIAPLRGPRMAGTVDAMRPRAIGFPMPPTSASPLQRAFAEIRPAATIVAVAGLYKPEMKIEIEVTAKRRSA